MRRDTKGYGGKIEVDDRLTGVRRGSDEQSESKYKVGKRYGRDASTNTVSTKLDVDECEDLDSLIAMRAIRDVPRVENTRSAVVSEALMWGRAVLWLRAYAGDGDEVPQFLVRLLRCGAKARLRMEVDFSQESVALQEAFHTADLMGEEPSPEARDRVEAIPIWARVMAREIDNLCRGDWVPPEKREKQ